MGVRESGEAEEPKLKVPDFQLRLTPEQSLQLFLLRRMGAFTVEPTALLRSEIDALVERLAAKLGLSLGDLLRIADRLRHVSPKDVDAALRDVWMPTESGSRKKPR